MKRLWFLYIIFITLISGYFCFLYPLETYSNTRFAAYRHALYFAQLPLNVLLLFSLIHSIKIKKWVNRIQVYKYVWFQALLFSGGLVILLAIVSLPFTIIGLWLVRKYDISHQPFLDWSFEWLVSQLLFWIALSFATYVIVKSLNRFKNNWWLSVWLIFLPIVLFVTYIQPVVITPLYEETKPLRSGDLRDEIGEIVNEAGIPNAKLLEVNMSEKTNSYNAYVTGIGNQARIVLWDTTIEQMEQGEVIFILNHEVAHYIKKHFYIGLSGYLLLSGLLLFISANIYRFWYPKLKKKFDFQGPTDLRNVIIIFLLLSIGTLLMEPLTLSVSRYMERQADSYAIERTDDLSPALESYYKLAVSSKSDVEPLAWVKWLRYSHPPIESRIEKIRVEMNERLKK